MSQHEIPADSVVCATLGKMDRPTARALVEALIAAGYNSRDSQRAIQRCLDRGKIQLGAGLRLQLSSAREGVAA
jgi:hypothetical protein